MFDLLVNAEGGLTTAGYVVTISVGIVLFLAAVFFAGKRSKRQKMTTKQLVFLCGCNGPGVCYVLCKDFSDAMGRQCDIMQHAVYCTCGKLVRCRNRSFGRSCLWNPAVYTGTVCTFFFQVCCDYILAFAALGVAGFFAKRSTDCLKVISRQFWQEVRFTHLGDICIDGLHAR